MVVGRQQAVQVALLYGMAYPLVVGNGLAGLLFLRVAHNLGLYFHAQSAAHCHIGAEFQRHCAECLVIGCVAYVRSHGHGREEVAGAPLHVYALQGIGVVAYPELVEVG